MCIPSAAKTLVNHWYISWSNTRFSGPGGQGTALHARREGPGTAEKETVVAVCTTARAGSTTSSRSCPATRPPAACMGWTRAPPLTGARRWAEDSVHVLGSALRGSGHRAGVASDGVRRRGRYSDQPDQVADARSGEAVAQHQPGAVAPAAVTTGRPARWPQRPDRP